MNKRTAIKVFITKTRKFRAMIKEPNQPAYEVTIGGTQWALGKGSEYKQIIMEKITNIFTTITNEYNICLND